MHQPYARAGRGAGAPASRPGAPGTAPAATAPEADDFRALFAAAPGAYLVLRADAPCFPIAAASDAYLAATHLTREDALGRGVFEVHSDANPANAAPSGVANLRASLEAVLRTGAPHRMPVQRYDVRRPDGTWDERYWAPHNVPVRDPAGDVRYILHHVEDVTAAVLGREALARSERRAAAVLDRITDAYIVLDRDFRFVEVNPAAERALQKTRAELLGQSHWEVFPASHDIDAGRNYRRAARERIALHFTEHYRYEGYDVHLEIDAYPTDEGGVAVFWRDVTARKRAEAERERLLAAEQAARAEAEAMRRRAEAERERAAEANASKSQFLANMSHELRTPLNAIGGYAQLLELGLHGPVSAEQQAVLGRVQLAQRRLLALINDVLNYAKLEGGRVEYHLGVVDVGEVIAEVAPLVEPQAAAKGLALAVRLPDGPCAVWADRDKLGQVLVNLLSNAVKFTEARHPATGAPGRVTLDVETRAGGGPDGGPGAGAGRPDAVFLRVRDTGRGIPREKQDAIFDPFVQVQTGYTRSDEGTGLGLAISRDLARGMGGDIRVRSAPGEGATFTVTLRRADEAKTGEVARAPVHNHRLSGRFSDPRSTSQ